MKKQVLSLLLAGALTLGLFGCSAQTPEESGVPQSAPAQTEGTDSAGVVEELKIGICKEVTPRTLASESGSFGRMNYNAFCAGTWLVRDENNEMQPNLMTSWEILDKGSTIRATFATDQGITWHDGEPFTIDDVIFTVDLMNNKLKSGYLSKITGVEKVDDTTVDFRWPMGRPISPWGTPPSLCVCIPSTSGKESRIPPATPARMLSSAAAPISLFRWMRRRRPCTDEAVGETYMGRALTVRSVTVRSYYSQDALVMALRTGEVDAMYDYSNPISPTMLPSISGVDGVDPGKGMNMGLFEILFGFQKQPTDDLEFRRAVRYALNYELLATTIGGEDGQVPGEGIISPAGIGYDDSLPKLVQDQEQAKAILEAAGYVDTDGDGWRERPDGTPMDVLVTPQYNATKAALYQRIAEIIVTNLGEVGVKCTLDEESIRNSDHEQQLRDDGAYEIYICYATQGVSFYKTPFLYMFNDDLSMWGTCDLEDFDQAYNDMLNAQGDEDYVAKVKELQRIASEEVIGIALCWDTAYYPYRTDKYEGWTNFPGWGVINCETWYNLHPIG
ncbi:MAG: ABC transporter substrate-binding protein [Flavonifractor plautii]